MPKTKTLTINEYYKQFVSVLGASAVGIGSIPFISSLFDNNLKVLQFPPIGDYTIACKIMLGFILVATSLIILFLQNTRFVLNDSYRLKSLIVLFFIVLISFSLNTALSSAFVKRINPLENEYLLVSIGYEKTDFAKKNLLDYTDYEILEKVRGFTEADIQKVWTKTSLIITRLSLLLSYSLFFVSAISILCISILSNALVLTPSNSN